jgi:hypothetical protein
MAILLLLFSFVSALPGVAQQPNEKKPIDMEAIHRAEIIRMDFEGPARSVTKPMAPQQCAEFARLWNAARPIGADKYVMRYYVHLYLKSGQKRLFAISGSKVQEDEWRTFDIGDRLYFDALWNAIE